MSVTLFKQGGLAALLSALLAMLTAVPAVAAEPASAPTITKERRFGSWGLSCAVAGDGRGKQVERCMVSQLVATDPKQAKVVLGVTVDYADSTTPTIRFRFTPAADRGTGVGIKVGDGAPLLLPINDCNRERCEAAGRLTPEVLKSWRAAKNARFAFRLKDGKQVTLPVSLTGLDLALAALRKEDAARPKA